MCSLFFIPSFFPDFQKQEGVLCAVAFRLLYDLIKRGYPVLIVGKTS